MIVKTVSNKLYDDRTVGSKLEMHRKVNTKLLAYVMFYILGR